MIKINILDEKEIKCYISRKYPDDKQNDAVISVNASEINNFFKGEDKNNWFVIEYLGPINSIANYLSLLTYKTFLKYFVEIILPECGTIEDATVVTTELIRANAYEEADSILCVNVDSRLLQGEIGFRIIVPKYNYVDMWNKKNPVTHTERKLRNDT